MEEEARMLMMSADPPSLLPSVTTSSSSEEERDDRIRRRYDAKELISYETPYKKGTLIFGKKKPIITPSTVLQMTPSPLKTPLSLERVSSCPSTAPTRSPVPFSSIESPEKAYFSNVQQGYLNHNISSALFQEVTPSRGRRKSRSTSRRSRLSDSLLLDDYNGSKVPKSSLERRRSSGHFQRSYGVKTSPPHLRPDPNLMELTPEVKINWSPDRTQGSDSRSSVSNSGLDTSFGSGSSSSSRGRGKTIVCIWGFMIMAITSAMGMVALTRVAVEPEPFYEPIRPEFHLSASGLRGQMTSGHWDAPMVSKKKKNSQKAGKVARRNRENSATQEGKPPEVKQGGRVKLTKAASKTRPMVSYSKDILSVKLPPPVLKKNPSFESNDPNMYSTMFSINSTGRRRVVALDPAINLAASLPPPRKIKLYPADWTDNTQLYPILDSSDERLARMELREPYSDDECVPMQDWQTTFHPLCNGMHEISMESMGKNDGSDISLFGTKGFWRYAWRLDSQNVEKLDTVVLKTLKYEHNFEDAHFEHDRIDAVAMERLTSSPHVIDVFGFCGHSVLTEYADGSRLGELADKTKKKPLERLKIARDIALGLADVHGIDGDGNATFVHLDVNPANVVSVGGTLKLNDFNIGIIRRWNTTSDTPCGFPAQYPNPQWRSPEEARGEQNLTEKIDVFSMGHIFFRLICGHEPWNKLEPGGRPSKEEINTRVKQGGLPFIPDKVRNSENPEVIAIRDAMLSCYTYDPAQRPSAREISTQLSKALEEMTNKR